MAGNRYLFEEAIQKANDSVWAEAWEPAISSYRRALAEFPDDVSAMMGCAWALLNNKNLSEAIVVYRRLTELSPTDPGPYERLAEIMERTGEPDYAAGFYLGAAQRYGDQKLASKRTSALEAAVRLRPNNIRPWNELLKIYQSQRDINKATLAALWLVYLNQTTNRERAIEICRDAETFSPHEPSIGQALMLMQSNRTIPQPPPIGSEARLPEVADLMPDDGGEGSPVEIARQRALTKLAESIFSDDRPPVKGMQSMEVGLLIGQAVDAQTRGDLVKALKSYEVLLNAGISMPSIHFNIGLLYKEQMQFDNAIVQLERSLSDPEYVLGSHYSLGQCYQAKGEFREAASHFLEAVKIVDIATIEREHVDDLIRVYEGLAQNLMNTGEAERAKKVSESLVEFLGQRGWGDAAMRARGRLDELARSGAVLSLVELVSLPNSEKILRSIALAQEYQRRGMLYSALEEIMNTLSEVPDYLPLHHLLATLLWENNDADAAIQKLHIIARTYEVRNQPPQALATFQYILQLAPLDIPVHRRVAEMLIQFGRIDDALAQYMQISDAYYQLAQPERAREVYSEAMRLAPRGSAERNWEVRILHHMADLDLQRLDWQLAIKDNEEILRISPDDERAYLTLYRLYPRTGRMHLGINILDSLIKRYLTQNKVGNALTVLEDLVKSEPESIPLRARIAQLYLNLGRRESALEHLDVLGDLQLEAGQKDAAVKTIEAILALDPSNREAYADLYREMTNTEPPPPRQK
ncbi:MAG: tetratricopeptide repeat protein [Anaerolineales bacterium]|nr:MAG: tetratricopeptide repeat protein [Anaerolineales bacterium]